MPSKSKAQKRLMNAAVHNPSFAKKVGVPVPVAKEFVKADTGSKKKLPEKKKPKKQNKENPPSFALGTRG